jgi:hypothetical protein
LDFVLQDLEFVAPGLDFVAEDLGFFASGLEIRPMAIRALGSGREIGVEIRMSASRSEIQLLPVADNPASIADCLAGGGEW